MRKQIIMGAAFASIALCAQNTVNVLMQDGTTESYAATDVDSISFSTGNNFAITANGKTTNYNGTAQQISFTKAIEKSDNLTLTSFGWLEEACVNFNLINGASSYNVYCKENGTSTYTKLDAELVRNYGTYGRADAMGLKAGSYIFKVVPVDSDGKEMTSKATESDAVVVKANNRQGFAHLNFSGVGAYKDDGTLKDGAQVVYVTNDNINTVTAKIITDDKGGTTTGIGLGNILYLKQKGLDTTPLDIRIIGCIDATKVNDDQLLSDQRGLQLKCNKETSDLAVTIEGVGNDATFHGLGITFYKATGVEMRNIAVMWQTQDGIQIKTCHHIWIHNNDIFYGQPGSDKDQIKGDGSLDIKDNSTYASLAYNHFFDSGKMSLCGMKSETGENWISYHHNWFDHSDSRHPRVRTMTVHVWNNYYDATAKYGAGAVMGANIFMEANYFRNVKRPMMISGQGSDALGEGTFSDETGGAIKSYNNIFAENPSSFSYLTQNDSKTEYDAYEASSRDEIVPSDYKSVLGSFSYNNFDTNSSLMYTYTPDAPEDVPSVVTGDYGAGRMQHGDFVWTFDNSTDDADYNLNTNLQTAVKNYTGKLVGIFGQDALSTDTSSDDSSSTTDTTTSKTDTNTTIEAPIEGSTLCSFTSDGPTDSNITVSGNYASNKGSVTVGDVTYSTGLKMESATTITLTTSATMSMTLYFGSGEAASIKLDGTAVTETSNVLTLTLTAGTHTLTKKNSGNLYLISLTPDE